MTHYLISDIGTQWFSYAIATEGDEVRQYVDIAGLTGPFLFEIYAREMHFGYRKFQTIGQMQTGPFYGWSITPNEFAQIRRMVELQPMVKEFNRLAEGRCV